MLCIRVCRCVKQTLNSVCVCVCVLLMFECVCACVCPHYNKQSIVKDNNKSLSLIYHPATRFWSCHKWLFKCHTLSSIYCDIIYKWPARIVFFFGRLITTNLPLFRCWPTISQPCPNCKYLWITCNNINTKCLSDAKSVVAIAEDAVS